MKKRQELLKGYQERSTEMNFELEEILEETDKILEEYKKNNDDTKKKL